MSSLFAKRISLPSLLLAALASGCSNQNEGPVTPLAPPAATQSKPLKPAIDRSGQAKVGVASFYADRFAGRTMADGGKMDPEGNNAASRTLPLGTKAKVTSLATGKSAVVVIEDRGPYAKGRILDLSPTTARRIGITPHVGVARVVVAPITVPLADGRLKPGVAAQDDLNRVSQD
jgi:rare lipoprotein A